MLFRHKPLPPSIDHTFDTQYFVKEITSILEEGRFRYIQPGDSRCESFLIVPEDKAPYRRGLTKADTAQLYKLVQDMGLVNPLLRLKGNTSPWFSRSKGIYSFEFDWPDKQSC